MHALTLDWRHRRGYSLQRAVANPFAAAVEQAVDGNPTVDQVRSRHEAFRSACTLGVMTCSAAQLDDPALAAWVRSRGVSVEVVSIEQLDFAISAGIRPAHIVVQGSESAAAPLRRAANIGVGGYVIGSAGQAAVLATAVTRRTPIVVDVTDDDGALEHAIRRTSPLELVGVRMRLVGGRVSHLGEATSAVMATMADVRLRHGILMTRLNLADVEMRGLTPGLVARSAAAIEDAVDESCARHRFPRPIVVLSPPTNPTRP
ncbi:hypothetical protein H7K45_16320 [Mycobacterium yunnanensis]|uniref:Orn/DAP/Arg decarboxylase 2 N-terminal domain-containing protein n=1 Tax=Mycobacterium yunnanensis TaxID=368477 RepID=A0A9X2Z5G4_9MYCO|nr:hypothetical protein [Mycobacterium yunnanensis]MCV7422117.1 hypothetical protein [Mycobacterium yunnanensis]